MDTTAQNTTSTTPQADPAGEPTTTVPATPQLPPAGGAPQGTPAPGLADRLGSYRMRRSTTDKMLGGVCGGLAADLGIDAALLRILVLVLTLFTGGAAAIVYLAVWIIAPAG
ncbi:hypothetical protein AD006_07865 [Pseudonocardia sp. EC080610-09]|nr:MULTISPECIES: PspC domain-containing protein [unclassified Pseudonocardia]ALL75234.1 hypothetical protein AD006_07865 [Pseudonocardia sp. EC080610-09]ALL82260.1 hypothetical protein AD017_15700 [Pseudonocardia sp. EC080619-01]